VGVADLREASHPDATITTHALGSCLGVTCYDRSRRVGAMLHAMLPTAKRHPGSNAAAAMFLDTGLAALCDTMALLGSEPRACKFKVFGGAQTLKASAYFRIGQHNIDMMRRLATEHNLDVPVWDVGGQDNRTITLHLENGLVFVRMPGRLPTLL